MIFICKDMSKISLDFNGNLKDDMIRVVVLVVLGTIYIIESI